MVVDVVSLRPLAGGAAEERSGECVAAGLRNEVDERAAHFGFSETARERQLHFLRIRGVDDVARHAAAVERGAGAQTVNRGASLVAAAAVAVEDAHRWH